MPDPRHVEACIEEFCGMAPLTLDTRDTVKNLADAEDGLPVVEAKNFQTLACKILHEQLGRPSDSVRDCHGAAGPSTAVRCLLAREPGDGHRGCDLLVQTQGQGHQKRQKVCDSNKFVKRRNSRCDSRPSMSARRHWAILRRRLIE